MKLTFKIWWIIIAIATLLRLWGIYSFEFKLDQWQAVQTTMSGLNPWEITHGMVSSTGLVNPPGFYQFLSSLRWLGLQNPQVSATLFVVISIATVALTLMFKKMLSHIELLIMTLLTASSPLLIFMAGNIWAQMLLAPLSFLVLFTLTKAHQSANKLEASQFWVLSVTLTIIAGSIHMAGFFLLPTIICLRPKNAFSKYDILACVELIIVVGVILGPYLYFILQQDNLNINGPHGNWALFFLSSILYFHGGTFGFWSFSGDYISIVGELISRPVALVVVVLLGVSSIAALIYSIVRYFQLRKEGDIPVIINLAVWLTIGFSATLLCSGITVYYYYWFILWAPIAVLTAFAAGELRLTYVTIYAILAVVLAVSTRYTIASKGGHTIDYGIDYSIYQEWQQTLDAVAKTTPVNLKIHITTPEAGQKIEAQVIGSLFAKYFNPHGKTIHLLISSENRFFIFNFVPE